MDNVRLRQFRRELAKQTRPIDLTHSDSDGYATLRAAQTYVELLEDESLFHDDPVEMMFNVIYDNVDAWTVQLLSGFRGTGKTTALWRLRQKLEQEGYAAIRIDVEDYLNTSLPLGVEEFLVFLAAAFDTEAERLGFAPQRGLVSDAWDNLLGWFRRVRINKVTVEAGIPDHAKVAVELGLRDRDALTEFRSSVQGRIGELAQDVKAALAETQQRVMRHRGVAEVVLLVDSIEHYRGTFGAGGNAADIQTSMQELFDINAQWLMPELRNLHVVYTVPPSLMVTVHNLGSVFDPGGLQTIPAVRVVEPNGNDHHPGLDRMVELARARIIRAGAEPNEIFEPEALRELARKTGGVPREFIRGLSEVQSRLSSPDRLPVDLAMVRRVTEAMAFERRQLSDADIDALRRVRRSWAVPMADADRAATTYARLLEYGNVLCYQNDTHWYAVNPLLHDILDQRMAAVPGPAPPP